MSIPEEKQSVHKRIKDRRAERKEQIRKDMDLYGSRILNSDEMREAFGQTHHLWSTVGEHTLRVASSSLRICYALRRLHIRTDIPAVVKGSLGHDLGMLGRYEKYASKQECGREHPRDSVKIARELEEDLPKQTADIIERHMWPAGKSKFPNSLECAIVSAADKYVSVKDLFKGSDVKHTGVKNVVHGRIEKIRNRKSDDS